MIFIYLFIYYLFTHLLMLIRASQPISKFATIRYDIILKKHGINSEDLNSLILKTGAFIAGGFITNVLSPFRHNQSSNDIDIYLPKNSNHDLNLYLFSFYFNVLGYVLTHDTIGTYSDISSIENVMSYTTNKSEYLPINLIIINETMDDLLKQFDLTCCMKSFDGKDFYYIDDNSYVTKIVKVTPYTVGRIVKYISRGFHIEDFLDIIKIGVNYYNTENKD